MFGAQYSESTQADTHCHDIGSGSELHAENIGVPGCVCPGNQVVNEAMTMCVDRSTCLCSDEYDLKKKYKPGETIETNCKTWYVFN